jgi:hypothetical protein
VATIETGTLLSAVARCDPDTLRAIIEDRAALKAENERLRSALESFADVANLMDSEVEGFAMTDELLLHLADDDRTPSYLVAYFALQKFFDARAALEPKP